MTRAEFIPLPGYREYPASEMAERAAAFYHEMNRRRTVRDFAAKPVPTGVIEECLRAAGTAPSGANMQPWHMVVVTDPAIKQRIRTDAEVEEREFYEHRAPQEWLDALAPLGTDDRKPFLETAPCLMGFLNTILNRPKNERPFLLLVVGFPAADASVPAITRKPLAEIATFV